MSCSRAARADMKRIVLDWAEAEGCEIGLRGGHYRITYRGRLVGAVAQSPSDHRSILNAKSFLRRNLARLKEADNA